MSVTMDRKRKRVERVPKLSSTKSKRSKQSKNYHSSSEDETTTSQSNSKSREQQQSSTDSLLVERPSNTNLKSQNSVDDIEKQSSLSEQGDEDGNEPSELEDDSGDGDEDASDASSGASSEASHPVEAGVMGRKPRKRNDPSAFATSISRILDSKLSTSKRTDPVLSRSRDASKVATEVSESRLDAKARRKLREERVAAREKGRVKDVLGLQSTDISTAGVLEEEKALKKMAQRGVVKLFNAVRAAQVKGEQAAKEAMKEGTVGMDQRQEKVNEMSKKGFLDLLVEGGGR